MATMRFLRWGLALSLSMACVGAAAAAQAANYPSRPIHVIVPFGPGSVTDLLARALASELAGALGQSIIVENKAGADGNIGAGFVAAAAPDGYTLMVGPASVAAINVSLHKSLAYDPLRDFAPITHIASVTNVLVVPPSVDARSVDGLIQLLRKRPLSFASTGAGGSMHLAGEVFKQQSRTDILHVPYKGGGAALPDLLSGRVDMMFCNLPLCLPHIRAGKLVALGVTSGQRSVLLPDVPTIAEAGVPDYAIEGWFGLFAPSAVPTAILDRLNRESVRILRSPAFKEKLLALGAEPVANSRQDFTAFVQAEHARWARVIREAKLAAQ